MGRGIVYWIFQHPRFCCCLPVRICVTIMALLGFLLSGTLSIILWFEVTSMASLCTLLSQRVTFYLSQGADGLTSKERGAFIGGAIVETLFFLISSVGYVLRGIYPQRPLIFLLVQTHWCNCAQASICDRVRRRAVRPFPAQPRRGGIPPRRHRTRHAYRHQGPVPERDQQHTGPRPVLDGLQRHPRRLCGPSISHPRNRAL